MTASDQATRKKILASRGSSTHETLTNSRTAPRGRTIALPGLASKHGVPDSTFGSACTSSFSRSHEAADNDRHSGLLGVHSHCGPHTRAVTKFETEPAARIFWRMPTLVRGHSAAIWTGCFNLPGSQLLRSPCWRLGSRLICLQLANT